MCRMEYDDMWVIMYSKLYWRVLRGAIFRLFANGENSCNMLILHTKNRPNRA